jgi:hypothetical protein
VSPAGPEGRAGRLPADAVLWASEGLFLYLLLAELKQDRRLVPAINVMMRLFTLYLLMNLYGPNMRLASFSFLLFFISNKVLCQVMPREDAELNYRIIAFSFPEVKGANEYIIEIAAGVLDEPGAFGKKVTQTIRSKVNKQTVEVPTFGTKYTWRATAVKDGGKQERGALHHFSTGALPVADANLHRFRVTDSAKKYADGYFFVDVTRTLYDMNGNAVWYLPDEVKNSGGTKQVQDLKVAEGTITFMTLDGFPYEIDYNANLLWTTWNAEQSATGEGHHEFTKLPNGNYMMLGNEQVYWPLKGKEDSVARNAEDSARMLQPITFGTVLEYNKAGKVVWKWRASEYLAKTEVRNHVGADGKYDLTDHVNSFFFNEKESSVYLSFRDLNRILRVQYPEGKVLNEYGKKYEPGMPAPVNEVFNFQHSCSVLPDGRMLLFNNNRCEGCLPQLLVLNQIQSKDELRREWEYEYRPAEAMNSRRTMRRFGRGGNIMALRDGDVFASFNVPNNQLLIVDRAKNTLWSGVLEQKSKDVKEWQPESTYRASFVTGEQFKKLIWWETDPVAK